MRERGLTIAKVQDTREGNKPGQQGQVTTPKRKPAQNETREWPSTKKQATPTNTTTSYPKVGDFKTYLEQNNVPLASLHFGGQLGSCYYCGQKHVSYKCTTNFGSSQQDRDRENARNLGRSFFKK